MSGSMYMARGLPRPPVVKSRTLVIRGARCQNFAGAVTRTRISCYTRTSQQYHTWPSRIFPPGVGPSMSLLPSRTPARPAPHPQGRQDESDQEHRDANDQQVQQPFRGNAHDPQHDRGYHQQQEKGNHPSSISFVYSAAAQQPFAVSARLVGQAVMLEYCLFISCGQLAVRINRRGVLHLFPVVGHLEVSRTHGRLVQGHEYEPAPGRDPDLDRAERRQVSTGVDVYGLKLPDFVTLGINHVVTAPLPDAGNLEHNGYLLLQRGTGLPALPRRRRPIHRPGHGDSDSDPRTRRGQQPCRSARHIFFIAMYRRTSGSDLTAITPSAAPAAAVVIAVTYPSFCIIFLLFPLLFRQRRPMRSPA